MRNRIFLIVIVVLMTIPLSGCSYYADFLLVNKTDTVLRVQWRLSAQDMYTVTAKVKTLQEFENDENTSWQDLPSERVVIGENFRSASVQLNPGEILLLVSKNIRDIKDEPKLKSSMKSLTIENENGSTRYEGDQIFEKFRPGRYAWFPSSYTLYTLTYQ